jgi:hypothetical protein
MDNFARSAVARNAPRKRIKDAIRDQWSNIERALDQGALNTSIAAQLEADFRVAVGSTSGFNAALNYVIAEKGYVRPSKPRQPVVPVTVPMTVAPVNVTPTIDAKPIVDIRRRMGWEDAS